MIPHEIPKIPSALEGTAAKASPWLTPAQQSRIEESLRLAREAKASWKEEIAKIRERAKKQHSEGQKAKRYELPTKEELCAARPLPWTR